MVPSGVKARFPAINAMVVSRIEAMMEISIQLNYGKVKRWLDTQDIVEMQSDYKPKPFKASVGWYKSLVKRNHWSNRVFTQKVGVPLKMAVFECCKHILSVRYKATKYNDYDLVTADETAIWSNTGVKKTLGKIDHRWFLFLKTLVLKLILQSCVLCASMD